MRASLIGAVSALAWAGLAQAALAWDEEGHAIVAEIAERRLSDEARPAVEELLGRGASMASYASWADDERSRDPATTRWHYVGLPLGPLGYKPERDCQFVEGQGDCLIAALEREVAAIACPTETAERRQRALKFIIHLAGDLSQPVHATNEQRGGNDTTVAVAIRAGARPKPAFDANLHEVWDTILVQKVAWSWGGYVERLEAGFLKEPATAALADGGPTDWLLDSADEATDIFLMLPDNLVLDDAYLALETPHLDRQLAAGGLRLAKILNEAFAAKRCPAG